MPMIPLIIGAGVGLLQANEQAQAEKAQRQTAAATIAYSPWTKASVSDAQASIKPATYASDIMGGTAAGARYAQGGYGGPGGNPVNGGDQGVVGFGVEGSPYMAAKSGKGFVPDNSPTPSAPARPWVAPSPYWNKNPYGSS